MGENIEDLIKKEIESGSSKEQVVSNLIFAGFAYREITKAFNQMSQNGELPEGYFSQDVRRAVRTPSPIKVKSLEEGVRADTEQTTGSDYIKETFRKFKILILAIIVLFVLIISGGLYWYFHSYLSPENSLTRIFASVQNIKSFEFQSTVVASKIPSGLEYWLPDYKGEDLTFQTNSVIIPYVENKINWSIIHSINIADKNIWSGYALGINNGGWYFKVDKLGEQIDGASSTYKEAEYAKGKWLHTNGSEDFLSTLVPANITSFSNSIGGVNDQDVLTFIKSFSLSKPFSNLVKKPDEIVNKFNTTHYSFVLNPNQISNFENSIQSVSNIIAPLSSPNLYKGVWDIWFDKNTNYPVKLSITPNKDTNSDIKKFEIYLWVNRKVGPISFPSQSMELNKFQEIYDQETKLTNL